MDPDLTTATRCRPTRVLVVDDQRLVRAAVRAAIEDSDDLVVVGEAGDGVQGLRLCGVLRPDVALVDLAGPGSAEVELTRRFALDHPLVQVMVVRADVDGDRMRRALDAGAVGYLLKDAEPHALREGVRAVARGESPLDPRAVRAMLRSRPSVRGEDLTVREREVLALVACGLANKQIARELQITDGTVKAHVGSIFTRIGVTDRTSAAIWAERNLGGAAVSVRATGREDWAGRGADRPAPGAPRLREPAWAGSGARLRPVSA